jgi:hypothetical protein
MGQHIRLEPIKEPKIFEEIKKIGKSLCIELRRGYFIPFIKYSILGKQVIRLTNDYRLHAEDDSVFNIGKFTLHEDWKEDKWLTENTQLECHFDKYGNVNAIYIVL